MRLTPAAAALACCLVACVDPLDGAAAFEPTNWPEPAELDPARQPMTLQESLAQPRAQGLAGVVEVDVDWFGRTSWQAIQLEYGLPWVEGDRYGGFIGGDGISCAAWLQYDAALRRIEDEGGSSEDAARAWNRFVGEQGWLLHGDAWPLDTPLGQSVDGQPLRVHRWVEPCVERADGSSCMELFGSFRGVLVDREQDAATAGQTIEVHEDFYGMRWDGGWVQLPPELELDGLGPTVRWQDVPRCDPGETEI